MHHYSTVVYAEMTCDPSIHYIWQHLVVHLALRRDYVLKTLLAVSALHLAKRLPPDRREPYTSAAYSYHQIALRSAMPLLSDADALPSDEAVNLFIFTSLTIFFGSVPHTPPPNSRPWLTRLTSRSSVPLPQS